MIDGGTIKTFADLAQLVSEVDGKGLLFRGEPKAYSKLHPKIGRENTRKDPKNGATLPYSPDDERRAFEIFRREAPPYIVHKPETQIEWLAIAQHHGMMTRLLDWTTSPMIAAYFATTLAGTQGTPVIYGLKMPNLLPHEATRNVFGAKYAVSTFVPPHITPRIPAQGSVFTVHPQPDQDYKPETLTRWVLPEGRPAWEMVLALNTAGITEASLFPDIDGLAHYCSWRYKWGRFLP